MSKTSSFTNGIKLEGKMSAAQLQLAHQTAKKNVAELFCKATKGFVPITDDSSGQNGGQKQTKEKGADFVAAVEKGENVPEKRALRSSSSNKKQQQDEAKEERGKKSSDEKIAAQSKSADFSAQMVRELSHLCDDVFDVCVQLEEATAVQHDKLRVKWVASKPFKGLSLESRHVQVAAKEAAALIVAKILEFLAKRLHGRSWSDWKEDAALDDARLVLGKAINGSPQQIKDGVIAFWEAYRVIYGKSKSKVAQLQRVDMMISLAGPWTKMLGPRAELRKESKLELAELCYGAAERSARAGKKKEATAAAPTNAASAGKQNKKDVAAAPTMEAGKQSRGRRDSGRGSSFECNHCHEKGHIKASCPQLKDQKQAQICSTCNAVGEHYTRACPLQTCLSCAEKGHGKRDCPKLEPPKQEGPEAAANKDTKKEYFGLVGSAHTTEPPLKQVAAAPVLLINAKINGVEGRVGLDSFAGIGMAAQKATEVRGVTLEPTDVAVIGVAETPVPSSGETTVSIDMGGGVIVNERVAVVPHLPGQADVLVSFDTLKDVGLEICKEKILVGGQQVKLVEQAAPSSREGAPGVRAAAKWEPTSEDRLIKDQLKEERRIVHELHQKVSTPEGPRHPRYGPRQVTFEQMWQENSVEEVGRDSEGRPWFKPALGATEQPLLDRSPSRQKKPMKSKKALPAVKSRKVDKRRIKQQRLNLEFAALETTLEEAIQLREEAEANQEFDSMIDRATRGYETAKKLQTESWKSVAASVVQKVVGLAEAPNSQTGPSRFVVAATAVAATEAPKTVRAAEVIERYAKTGEWVRADTEDLLGPEQLPEIVDVDEYCMPNPPDPVKRAEMEAEFEKIIAKSNYSESSKEEYRRIIREHGEPYLLQLEPQDVGKLKKTPLRIMVDPSVPPQRDKRRTQTPENDQWLKEWFTKSDQLGITFKPSPEQEHRVWVANPLVVTQVKPVTKKVEKRLCVDYWMVNKHVQLGPQRVPLMSEFADRVHGAVLLDGDDGFSGYYQYPLDEDSRLLTGVWTPLGIRCFASMPMGISPAPEKWNTAMAEVLADLPTNRFFQYMDDFFRFTGNETGDKTREQIEREHLELFRQFLIRGESQAQASQGNARSGGSERSWSDVWTWREVED